jgi:hypothetical protein
MGLFLVQNFYATGALLWARRGCPLSGGIPQPSENVRLQTLVSPAI